jgi:soluble lytic murein transglycosylase-like protein
MSAQSIDALASKWGRVFQVPKTWIKNLSYVETGWRPGLVNSFGTAFGLMQMKIATVNDLIRVMGRFKAAHSPEVGETISLWTGKGEDLLDPDLNVMFAAFYLKILSRSFGDLVEVIAAAYNQGQGAVGRALKEAKKTGRSFAEFLKPAGRAFISRTLDARQKGFA